MKFFLPKISIIFFLLLFSLFFLSSPSLAQAKTEQANYPVTNTNPDVPNTLHNWTQNVMIEVMSSLVCQLTGIDPVNINQGCLGVDQKTGKIGFMPSPQTGGAIGVMGNMISMLYTPQIHTSDYFQNLAQNFGITKTTYAQEAPNGVGFEGLKPLLGLWSAFRNIIYLVFVIVFVVIGLAIMLRVKIDPRTVMTIQNQIPKIIIGILLVTFSYAIAGFLIDIMYVSIHIIGNILISADPNLNKELITQLYTEPNPFQAAGHVGANGGNSFIGLWNLIFSPAKGIGEIIGSIITSLLGGWGGFITRFIFGGIAGILAFLVIAIALFIALFRLWFALIFAYINVLLDVVLAPFWIMGSLVPGSPINVSGWLRHLIANLAAFPATIAMLLLGKIFMDVFGDADVAKHFVPPLIGDRASPKAIGAIIGLGIILMTPNVVNMLKTALKVPKIETGLGKSIGAGIGAPGGLVGSASKLGHTAFGLQQLSGAMNLPIVNKWLGKGRGHP